MRPLWLCWALWVLPLAGPGAALTGEQLLDSLLRQLQLSEVPVLDRADMEELAIPAHVRAQYVALLQRSHRDRSRGKRFSQRFQEVAGRFLASEASTHLLVFSMEQRLPPNRELVQAVLRLFQEPVPRAALHRHGRLSPRSDRARVTVKWLSVRDDGSNRTSLIDSRLVSVHESGWKAFDVTEAVNFWQQLSRPRQPLLLQVSVQREHLGPGASEAHRLVRFASQGTPPGRGEPSWSCNPDPQRNTGRWLYIDLQGMKSAENWGAWALCGHPAAAPRGPCCLMPMIVSIKEGGRPRPGGQPAHYGVQQCSCASDGELQP
uniref:TGF-beta propeptide domain-containing protein n=1 Tax=Aotus nancymaae TaxID=37293 RepID=A0A2K5DRN0_AOTNA